MAKYLITGGCGFIGSQLAKKLFELGHEIIIVDDLSNGTIILPQAKMVQKDITELSAIHDLFVGIDGCFHLAAFPAININIEQWFPFHKINLTGSLNVFKAAIDAENVPVIYASTCGVYDDDNQFPLSEDQFLKPHSSYGCDKLATELNAGFLAHAHQLPSMGLRFFNVYGPYQKPSSPYSGVITRFITQLLADQPLTIYGDGEQTRDFVYVDDIVDNLIYALNSVNQKASVVNICSGKPITINKLADLIADLLGKKCVKNYLPPRTFDVRNSFGSQKKMKDYGFKLEYEINEGLLKTIEYFKSIK